MTTQDSGMDLREFVRDVLLDIVRGVHEAADTVKTEHESGDRRGAINPMSEANTNDVEFDVVISVSTSLGGGLNVSVPIIEAGFGGSADHAKQRTSRVKFSVPVAFASQPVGKEFTYVPSPGPAPADNSPTKGPSGTPGPTD